MLYGICCAFGAVLFMLGAAALAGALLWLLCRPKKREPTFAVLRFAADEKNAAARVSFLLVATAMLFGAENTAVIAVLAPGAAHLRRELAAAFRSERRLCVCTEDDFSDALRKKTEEIAEKSR